MEPEYAHAPHSGQDTCPVNDGRLFFYTEGPMAKLSRKRRFVTWYRHYRTGKVMWARDYGYKAWPF